MNKMLYFTLTIIAERTKLFSCILEMSPWDPADHINCRYYSRRPHCKGIWNSFNIRSQIVFIRYFCRADIFA